MKLSEHTAHIPHNLHTNNHIWRAGASMASLWIEILHGWGFEPLAVMPSAITQHFDGDQFTGFEPRIDDLERLYGVTTSHLAIYDTLEAHLLEQTRRGNVVLVELDPYYLPDTVGLYKKRHGATLVGIDFIDPIRRVASYHRGGHRYEIEGNDYLGLFSGRSFKGGYEDALIRQVVCVKRISPSAPSDFLPELSVALLKRYLQRVPERSPIRAFQATLGPDLDARLIAGKAFRHAFAFSTLRQLGSNFELFGAYLGWLGECGYRLHASMFAACQRIAAEALVCQLRMLRATSRGHVDRCADSFDAIERCYQSLLTALHDSEMKRFS